MKYLTGLFLFLAIIIAQTKEEREQKIFELLTISKPVENVLPEIEFISHLSILNDYEDSLEIRKIYDEVFDKKKFYNMFFNYLAENYHPVFIDQLISAFSNSKFKFIDDLELVNKLKNDAFYINFYRNYNKIRADKISGRAYHLAEKLTEVQLKSKLFFEILNNINPQFTVKEKKSLFETEEKKVDKSHLAKSYIRALYYTYCDKLSYSKIKRLINFSKSDAGQLYYRGLETTYTKFYRNAFREFMKKAGI